MYVDVVAGARIPRGSPRLPVVMLHGAFHTGSAYLTTPDGRPGWAALFAERGHDVYMPDWPGHGRSPLRTPLSTLSTVEVAHAVSVLARDIGPAILLAHSAAGPMAWWMAEQHPELVAAVVGVAPGPPANLSKVLPDDPVAVKRLQFDEEAGCPVYSALDAPVVVDDHFIRQFWANSPQFPQSAIDAYARSIVPESARILNERFHIGGSGLALRDVARVRERPILIVTGECDPRHPRAVDARLADFLGADFLWLPDAGCAGNGHLPMCERNSDAVAALILQWMGRRGL